MNQKKRSQRNTPKVVYPFMNALLTLFQMIALYSGEVKKKKFILIHYILLHLCSTADTFRRPMLRYNDFFVNLVF